MNLYTNIYIKIINKVTKSLSKDPYTSPNPMFLSFKQIEPFSPKTAKPVTIPLLLWLMIINLVSIFQEVRQSHPILPTSNKLFYTLIE